MPAIPRKVIVMLPEAVLCSHYAQLCNGILPLIQRPSKVFFLLIWQIMAACCCVSDSGEDIESEQTWALPLPLPVEGEE